MHPAHREALDRVSVETSAMTKAARESCDQSAEHVKQSREAIERSLRLLGERFHGDDD